MPEPGRRWQDISASKNLISKAQNMQATERNNRILVIDDNHAIHADVRKILCPQVTDASVSLRALESALLGNPPEPLVATAHFAVDSAYQGREGLALVEKALAAGQPYAMAFVDVRMPPGWDGIETTLELWKVAPDLQIVICTAYSDYSWEEMLAKIGGSDRLVILKKPFDTIEVLQLANALTEKWNLLRQANAHAEEMERRVRVRTADLEATNATLQREIGRRAQVEADLQRAKEAAETADRAKSAFLANMSHEVRTPMNGVIGMANLLLTSPLNAEQRDLVETLCQSSETLLRIINDILDFSKIEAGRLALEVIDFDLTEHLELAVDLNADFAARKGLELVMQIDPALPRVVRGDPVRLRQIVLNLLGNAIKFTQKGDVVMTVSPSPDLADGIGLRFEICDSGIGIPEAVQKALFQPFVQADSSTTRKYGGTGLGLAICKRLTELMNGEIGVTSVPGEGSSFWFTLQLGRSLLDMAEPKIEPCPLEGHRILAVDDNAANRKLLTHLLAAWRMPHAMAESAAEALAELRRAAAAGTPYEAVILDHHMPERDGLDLAGDIRADASLRRLPLMLLTSRGECLNSVQMKASGLAACELKPLHPDKLRTAIGRVLAAASRVMPAPAAEAAPMAGVLPPLGAAQILLAEDNPVNQKVTLLQLRNLGHAADVAGNGLEALAALRRRRYALVLMDAQMPEMDGLEATRQIRRAEAIGEAGFESRVSIVAMTANAMSGDREACLGAGMDDYLAKPVTPEELRDMLLRHLKPAGLAEPVAYATAV
jgi:two-component system, sensor histidine kinase and response regulator